MAQMWFPVRYEIVCFCYPPLPYKQASKCKIDSAAQMHPGRLQLRQHLEREEASQNEEVIFKIDRQTDRQTDSLNILDL